MKILMLCPLISSSSFITTYPFAKILSKRHEVELMGPLLGKKPYIEDSELNFSFVDPSIKKPIQLAFMSLYKKNLSVYPLEYNKLLQYGIRQDYKNIITLKPKFMLLV
ncbi:MAG: hypothetical protein KKC05_04145 [Nanoarchaeota archaeon]|nr:hypothetical protein [Nanoarchaeota archaeon]